MLGPALLEVLLLGFPALGFPDSARVKCGGSFEMESRALLPVDGGGEPFSGRRDDWSLSCSGSAASSTGAVLVLLAAEKALNSCSTTNPIARNESSVGDLSPGIPAEHTPPMATNADSPRSQIAPPGENLQDAKLAANSLNHTQRRNPSPAIRKKYANATKIKPNLPTSSRRSTTRPPAKRINAIRGG